MVTHLSLQTRNESEPSPNASKASRELLNKVAPCRFSKVLEEIEPGQPYNALKLIEDTIKEAVIPARGRYRRKSRAWFNKEFYMKRKGTLGVLDRARATLKQ
jgi:hypothetical protein